MIHILTVHYKSIDWIPVQYRYINKYIKDYKIYSFIDQVKFTPWPFEFDLHHKEASNITYGKWGAMEHALKLDALVSKIKDPKDDDILMFLDGDAFPIKPVNDYVNELLLKYEFISVVRQEMNHTFPHPSLSVCRYDCWRQYDMTWLPGESENIDVEIDDPGVILEKRIHDHNVKWKKLLRTKSLDNHPVFFGIYDDILYHHTAGFRDKITRWDLQNSNLDTNQIQRANNSDSVRVFNNIKHNKYWW